MAYSNELFDNKAFNKGELDVKKLRRHFEEKVDPYLSTITCKADEVFQLLDTINRLNNMQRHFRMLVNIKENELRRTNELSAGRRDDINTYKQKIGEALKEIKELRKAIKGQV